MILLKNIKKMKKKILIHLKKEQLQLLIIMILVIEIRILLIEIHMVLQKHNRKNRKVCLIHRLTLQVECLIRVMDIKIKVYCNQVELIVKLVRRKIYNLRNFDFLVIKLDF